MTREAQIPLALWVSAAVLVHWFGGRGAVEVATVVVDQRELRQMVSEVRAVVRDLENPTMEAELLVLAPTPQELVELPTEAELAEQGEADPAEARAEPEDDPQAAKDPERVEKKEEPKEPEKKKEEDAYEAPPVVAEIQPKQDSRIAIQQHTPKDQPDNPNAPRIADHAHTTELETVARIRAYDQNAVETSPGARAGAMPDEGNADESRIAHAEEKEGNPDHAPGESAEKDHDHAHQDHEHRPVQAAREASPGQGGPPGQRPTLEEPSPPPNPGGAGPAAPEIAGADRGAYTVDPANPGGDGHTQKPTRKIKRKPFSNPVDVRQLGLGGTGLPGMPALSDDQFREVVGDAQLRAERIADGASRRSRHRGSFDTNKWDRYKAAVENYEPSVKLGNQTALNAAAVPFASYLNSIHNRLHPIFADEFLGSLDNLSPTNALNQNLVTHVEIVVKAEDGSIVRMGVTKPSGSTTYDVAALDSVERASPFGKAPDIIRSPDGNVYLHWEFHRNPFDACSTRNASPFILKNPPKITPATPFRRETPVRPPSDERPPAVGPLLPLKQP